jgi:hypothetical protein
MPASTRVDAPVHRKGTRITFDTCHGLTNAGVAPLARLPKLRELRISGRRVTPDVRAAFPSRVEVFCGD